MLIIDRGREIAEKSVFLIENGIFKGMGFFDLNHQISNKQVLLSLITPMTNNKDNQHIIQSYMRRNKRLKIIELSE
jgi:DNA polymerase-3 subunit epsilon